MKKKILLTLILGLVMQTSVMAAQTSSQSAQINAAIKKYKAGNYAGCLQDMQAYVKRDPSNAVAYYYIAISYAQANNKDEAIKAYEKAIALKSNPIVTDYATTGKRCLETPDKCKETEDLSDLDKFVQQPFGDGLSKKVKDDLESKHLDALKNDINKDKEIDVYELKKFNKSEAKPSNAEVVNALKVLEKAGFSNLVQNSQAAPAQNQVQTQNQNSAMNEYAKVMNDPQIMAQNQQMQQLQMMMGNGNNNNNQNNNFMNMLPYMMAQSGQGGQGSNMSPQLIQSMLMNSMMPSFDFDTNKDRN